LKLLRPHNLYYRKTMTNASTWKDDLPKAGKCTRLVVYVEQPINSPQHQLGETGPLVATRVADHITKLEVVVDGNHPIKSVTGIEAQIFNWYASKKMPPDMIRDLALGRSWSIFIFDFGRYFGDPLYYLDWEKHKSAELRVTNNVDGTIWTGLVLCVDEWLLEDPAVPPSKGVFVDRELKEYTTVQNGEEPTEIPTTDPVRSLILRAVPATSAAAPYHYKRDHFLTVETLNLSFKEEKEKILDNMYARELMWANTERYGLAKAGGVLLASQTGNTVQKSGIGYRRHTVVSFADIVGTALITNFIGAYTYRDNPLHMTPQSATNCYADWIAEGDSFHDSFMLFDAEEPVEQNLLTSDKAPVRLKVKTENNANAAGATVDLLLSTLEEYGKTLGK